MNSNLHGHRQIVFGIREKLRENRLNQSGFGGAQHGGDPRAAVAQVIGWTRREIGENQMEPRLDELLLDPTSLGRARWRREAGLREKGSHRRM